MVDAVKFKNRVSLTMGAVLVLSSVSLACYLGIVDHDIASGVRWYIAQAFLLAGSLFGLDYYVHGLISRYGSTRN